MICVHSRILSREVLLESRALSGQRLTTAKGAATRRATYDRSWQEFYWTVFLDMASGVYTVCIRRIRPAFETYWREDLAAIVLQVCQKKETI